MATSTGAFVGSFPRGLLNEAVQLFGMADFEREYGGVSADSEASYAIQQFFLNGGTECFVVRVTNPGPPANQAAAASSAVLENGAGADLFSVAAGRRVRGQSATNPGSWGDSLRIEVDYATRPVTASADTDSLFNMTVSLVRVTGDKTATVASERFVNLTMADGPDNVFDVVNAGSTLVQLTPVSSLPTSDLRPAATGTVSGDFPKDSKGPTAATSIDITLTINGSNKTITNITVPKTVAPSRLIDWANNFQAALRAAAGKLTNLEDQPYLSDATVEFVGENSTLNPSRMVVRLGRSARPFDATAKIKFAGTDVATYRLDSANKVVVTEQLYSLAGGKDGSATIPGDAYKGVRSAKTGIYALEDVDLFNILCIPDAPTLSGTDMRSLYAAAEAYCEERRSMLLLDLPSTVVRLDQMQAWLSDNETLRHPNAAVYFPRTRVPDPQARGRLRSVASSGTIAGLYARTDTQRGVWKAPAGTDARLRNVQGLDYLLTDPENGALNPLGINCLRTFPVYSSICWGARTMEGADQIASDWKYVPVRRLTLFLEESLYRGTKWVVFEPNDEPLWAQIRLNVGAFMQDLFRKGAFQGSNARDAYFVRCDGETTTQNDIDNGIVNVEVGFAPLKPAEFVILKIQQIARRAEI
ncbi:MAG: phage tail protein [Pseudomonadota bacterium]|nr:phage tail protein [Pseudomonadota bacterium]